MSNPSDFSFYADQEERVVWARGPVGFQHIETAPKDGSWLRFRFRNVEYKKEIVGRWEPHAEMNTGGSWFDPDGCYITPGPLFWAPVLSSQDGGAAK